MKILFGALCALGLLAAPAHAVTRSDAGALAAPQATLVQGEVEAGGNGSVLMVAGKAYVLTPSTQVFDHAGAPAHAAALTAGRTVAMSVAPGSQRIVKQVWIVQ